MGQLSSATARRIFLAGVLALGGIGMCYRPSRLAAQVTDEEYDVYRAFLASHPAPPGHAVLVQDVTDGNVMLCPHLMTSDKNLLWDLIRDQGKTFALDKARLGAATVGKPPAAGAYELLKFTRVSFAAGSVVGVLQASITDCDAAGARPCAPERSEVFTASKTGGAWGFRGHGCVQVARPQYAGAQH